jgi:benzaldehyde dehydrogenase (NAD)
VSSNAYGLSVGVLGDVGQAKQVTDQVRSGKIRINEQTVADESSAPFGGVGRFGNGACFGGYAANIEAFTELQ